MIQMRRALHYEMGVKCLPMCPIMSMIWVFAKHAPYTRSILNLFDPNHASVAIPTMVFARMDHHADDEPATNIYGNPCCARCHTCPSIMIYGDCTDGVCGRCALMSDIVAYRSGAPVSAARACLMLMSVRVVLGDALQLASPVPIDLVASYLSLDITDIRSITTLESLARYDMINQHVVASSSAPRIYEIVDYAWCAIRPMYAGENGVWMDDLLDDVSACRDMITSLRVVHRDVDTLRRCEVHGMMDLVDMSTADLSIRQYISPITNIFVCKNCVDAVNDYETSAWSLINQLGLCDDACSLIIEYTNSVECVRPPPS